jgi:hypothetical protein
MSARRRALWTRSGLLALVVLALLAFTLHSLRLSDASFVAASNNLSNVFITGTLGHINNRDGQVLITATGMKPGSSVAGTMTLTGTGDLAGDYTLSGVNLVDTPVSPPLSETLCMTIEDTTTGDTLYDDVVSEFDSIDLGTIASGQTESYLVTLYYPDGPTNGAVQGSTMSLTLQVEGVSQ